VLRYRLSALVSRCSMATLTDAAQHHLCCMVHSGRQGSQRRLAIFVTGSCHTVMVTFKFPRLLFFTGSQLRTGEMTAASDWQRSGLDFGFHEARGNTRSCQQTSERLRACLADRPPGRSSTLPLRGKAGERGSHEHWLYLIQVPSSSPSRQWLQASPEAPAFAALPPASMPSSRREKACNFPQPG
jgi:hypothetical protein